MKIRGTSFARFLYTYIVLMVSTIIAAVTTYTFAYRTIEEDTLASWHAALQSNVDLVDSRLDEVLSMQAQITESPAVRELLFVDNPLEPKYYFDLLSLQQLLQKHNMATSFVSDIILYFIKSDTVVTADVAQPGAETYFEHYGTYAGIPFRVWKSLVLSSSYLPHYWPSLMVSNPRGGGTAITVVRMFPTLYRTNRAVILIQIPESAVLKHLAFPNTTGSVELYVTRSNGQIIAPFGYFATEDRGEFVTVQSSSTRYGYVCHARIPRSLFFQKLDALRRVFGLIISGEVLLGLMLAVFFAYRQSKPIARMAESAAAIAETAYDDDNDDLAVIEHTLTNLVSSNEDLRNELDRQRPLLRATFVQRLLLGLHTSDVDAVDEAAELGVPTGNGTYTVAVVHVPGRSTVGSSQSPELPDILRIVVLDAIKTAIGQEVLYSTQSPEDTAVILLDVNHQTLSEGLSKVAERMTEEFGVRVVISVGADAQSLIEVSKSYQNAIDTRDYLLFTGRVGIGFYADVSQGSGRFLYPVEYELSLIRATESGNEEEVGRLFDSFLGRHIAGNQFSVHDTQQLFFDLRSTLMRIASAILGTSQESPAHADFAGIRERLENLDSHRSPEDLYPRIRELFLDLSRYVAEHQRSHNDALNERIRTYLIENFTDPTLNLAMIADTFKLTEQYVSAFFKEHNGVGYLEFVEELRLERARELLRDSGASVQQVAGEVGYANPNTFYKAFKRHFGQSPTTFRNQVSAKR